MNENSVMRILKLRKEIKKKLEEIDKLVGEINAIVYTEEKLKSKS